MTATEGSTLFELLISGACIRFYFKRVIFYQFVSNYLPAILLAVASFSPYFMSVHSMIDRINVSITLFQALLNVYAQVSP